MLTGDIPPNQTIYIKNLSEKIKKEVWNYGRILDVIALKTTKLRGQAWVVFSEVTAASNAVRQMQNFPFYDQPMRIQFSKGMSDCIAKAEGSFVPKDKRKERDEKDEKKSSDQSANGVRSESNGGTPASSHHGRSSGRESTTAPNNILFLQSLPHNTTSLMLQKLFEQYPGFREVRMIDAKPGIAFVEFEDDMQSSVAMQALQDFKNHSPESNGHLICQEVSHSAEYSLCPQKS